MLPGFVQLMSPMWGWALLAAAGVPLLAHLLSRRGGRLAPFPAVRFVQQAAADCARFLRPRHWLLLLLRMLLLALIALAFARPIWYRTAPPTDVSQGVITALVLDRSASMTRTQRGATLFEAARQQVIQTLRSLDPARDLATVVLLDRQPRTLLPEPTAGFSNLIAMVERLEATQEQGDLEAALRLASAETSYATQAGRDSGNAANGNAAIRPAFIEVFSDMQQSQWADILRRGAAPAEATLSLRRVGDFTGNVALFQPRINPVRPIVGQSAVVSVEVANFSDADVQPTVEMRFGDERTRQTLRIPAGTTISASFTLTPSSIGSHVAELHLVDHRDSLTLDDATAATFTVAAARPVALVTDARTDDPTSAAFFIERALRPESPDTPGERPSGVALARWQPMQLAAALQAEGRPRPDVIVICEATTLSRGDLQMLHGFIRQGGGVIWIVDSRAAANLLEQFNSLIGDTPLSPIVPETERWRLTADLSIATGQFDDPVLALFEGPARTAVVNTRFRQVLAGRLPLTATALLTFEDGTPALAAQWIGSGRLAVFGASLAPSDSDLVKGPVLVPLLHQLLRHLTPGIPAEANPQPGARPKIAVDGRWRDGDLEAVGPQGRPLRVTLAGMLADATLLELEPVASVGRIEVRQRGESAPLASVQVELHPGESDMHIADEETLAQFAQPRDVLAGGAATEVATATATLRSSGVEMWPYLVAAALIMAMLETLTLMAIGGTRIGAMKR